MTPLTRTLALLALALAAALTGHARADEKPKEEPKKLTLMQRKLLHSQAVLEGLATNNFEKIGAGGAGLLDCVNDATWKINETEKYLAHSADFRKRAEALKKAAKDKNLDAAALAYVDMTLTCVKCHQYLREDRPSR
jgi:cytochrome c556